MKNTRFFVLALTVYFLLVSACKESPNDGFETIRITVDVSSNASFKLSQVIDSLSYLVLETKDESLIGRPSKVVYRSGRYFVGDSDIAQAIFVFSSDGSFEGKIQSMGQGPGEYMGMTDFCVDEMGQVIIYDGVKDKILLFNDAGEFVESISVQNVVGDFIGILDDRNRFVLYSSYRTYQGKANLMELDDNGRVVKKHLFIDKNTNVDLTVSSIDLCGYSPNKIQFCQLYDNVAYRYENGFLHRSFEFDFGQYNLPKNYIVSNEISRRDPYCKVCYTRETENCLYYCVNMQDRMGLGFYMKSSKKNFFASNRLEKGNTPFINDVDGMDFYNFYGSAQHRFFSFYEVSEILDNPVASEELRDVINGLEYEHNPILVSFYVH
ncbi:MAG TPA: 6-bladed beta-propeller [Bacteroidales bacterium]|nr:6-bladed beta-propeller [Bacteroidales bacterium]